MIDDLVDILIVGGGLVGAALMLALKETSYRVCIIEAHPISEQTHENFDARSLALSPASVHILQTLHLWTKLEAYATPIETIHVSEQSRFGRVYLQDEQKKPLGYVIEMQHIQKVFLTHIDVKDWIAPAKVSTLNCNEGLVTINDGSITRHIRAKLIVAADGADSILRKLSGLSATVKDYEQRAVVANIGLQRPHLYAAYERFTAAGPMALLPMSEQRMSLVWALPTADAHAVLSLDEKAFLHKLQATFGYRLGRFIKLGQRTSFPLRQVIMPEQVAWPLVFVGNAAHTLHPIAGQGFNLGLRDVAMLAQSIVEHGLKEDMLQIYAKNRQHDQKTMTFLTHGLVKLFKSQLPGLGNLRSVGLSTLSYIPYLETLLKKYARGFAGELPDLVCQIPLKKIALEKSDR